MLTNNLKGFTNKEGFTMIELLMVIVVIAILAAVAVPQFINYQANARQSATSGILGAIRTGIQMQYGQMQISCADNGANFPAMADLVANDITNSECTTGQIPNQSDRRFISDRELPDNPWGTGGGVTACVATGCSAAPSATNSCIGSAVFSGGWCYNVATGDFWADSNSSTTGTGEWSL